MIGLIYKDIMALKKQLSILIVFIFVYGGLCLVGAFDFSILGALIAVFGLTVPMSSVTLDEAARQLGEEVVHDGAREKKLRLTDFRIREIESNW